MGEAMEESFFLPPVVPVWLLPSLVSYLTPIVPILTEVVVVLLLAVLSYQWSTLQLLFPPAITVLAAMPPAAAWDSKL